MTKQLSQRWYNPFENKNAPKKYGRKKGKLILCRFFRRFIGVLSFVLSFLNSPSRGGIQTSAYLHFDQIEVKGALTVFIEPGKKPASGILCRLVDH